jgi:tetratricopeptide (TPR) repeat protein
MFLKVLAFAALMIAPAQAVAAWHEAKSKHFTIFADMPAPKLRSFADRLERFDSAVRVARGTPDVQAGNATRVTLYILPNIESLRALYGNRESSVAGFYIPKASGSVAFIPDEGESGKWGLSGASIFFHEYSHHLMMQEADRPMPAWVTEGFAEFYGTPRFEANGSVVIGAPPRHRAEGLYTMWSMPLEKMLSGDYRGIRSFEWESVYSRGWLLTHLLSFESKRRGQMTKYLDGIATGDPPREAAVKAFGDIKQLDRELDAYFKKDSFTAVTIDASKLNVPPIQVRELSKSEAAVMPVRIKLARGDKTFAKELAGKARGIARDHSNDAAVLTALAQAELEAGYPDRALEAADRGLKLAPTSDQLILAKGKAMMEQAKAGAKNVDWAAVRALFSEANRLDPENAEPLALFHRSFIIAGQKPTLNALKGLGYALVLAPQDTKLRMDLTGHLIDEQRWADARRALIPLAYTPHTGKWRDAIVAVFDQVEARNASGAKEKWKAAQKMLDDD